MMIDPIEQLSIRHPVAAFFDIDGTLAPIAAHPEWVVIAPHTRSLLAALAQRLNGAVGILTGRPLVQAQAMLAPMQLPVAAEHGAVICTPCGTIELAPQTGLDVNDLLSQIRQGTAIMAGVAIEPKRFGVAIHYRHAPQFESALEALAEQVAARHVGLTTLRGKMVIELKLRGVNKGMALKTMLEAPPFQGRCPVVFGDDVTDEPAFMQAQTLGGMGFRIGAGASAAAYRLAGQDDLPRLMARWLASLPPDGARCTNPV